MALIFSDSFEQHYTEDLPAVRLFDDMPAPKYPGVYSIEVQSNGTAKVIRSFNGETETQTLAPGGSAWGIHWNGIGYSIEIIPDDEGSPAC